MYEVEVKPKLPSTVPLILRLHGHGQRYGRITKISNSVMNDKGIHIGRRTLGINFFCYGQPHVNRKVK